ncbi:hypothetical protein M426DRAFT_185960 [Hypoxylon sp. CI-4A]|nr:hypothetical protein M426DRAFT_185960 [Hypoxylon sp. CI-4A]
MTALYPEQSDFSKLAVPYEEYINFLKQLKFKSLFHILGFVYTPIKTQDYKLCSFPDGKVYCIRPAARGYDRVEFCKEPLVHRHPQQFHLSYFKEKTDFHWAFEMYLENIVQIRYHDTNIRSGTARPPRYAVCHGEMYLYKPRVNREGRPQEPPSYASTNWFIFMNIVGEQRSLWIMYGRDCRNGSGQITKYQDVRRDPDLFPNVGAFDTACIATSISSFEKDNRDGLPRLDPLVASSSVKSSAADLYPESYIPDFDELFELIGEPDWEM